MLANRTTFGRNATRIPKTSAMAFVMLSVVGCLPDRQTTRDYSGFETYAFQQTPGLGFCGRPGQVFSASLTRSADGAVAFSHAVLALAGPDPAQCQDGVATDAGCFRPKDQPNRTLNPQEVGQVDAVFAEVSYLKQPDRMCKDIAFDPCMIERHSWDEAAFSNYICGIDRLTPTQTADIRNLFETLRSAP